MGISVEICVGLQWFWVSVALVLGMEFLDFLGFGRMMESMCGFRFLLGLGWFSGLLKLEFIFNVLVANFQNLGSILGRKI